MATRGWIRMDDEELQRWLAAPGGFAVLREFAGWLRTKLKHGELSEEERTVLGRVNDEFYSICGEEGIDPYEH